MALSTVTGEAPSHWANALINGDWNEISTAEAVQVRAFRDWLLSGDSRGSVVSCEPAGFMRHHDATAFGVLACDCEAYTALIERAADRMARRTAGLSAWNHTAEELRDIVRARRNQYGIRLTFRDGSAAFMRTGSAKVESVA